MRTPLIALCCVALLAVGCQREAPAPAAPAEPAKTVAPLPADHDEQSYAEPLKVKITHMALDLAMDFDARTLAGTVTYDLDWLDPKATELRLDTRDLEIEAAEAKTGDTWQPLQFALAEADKTLGSQLTIQTPERPAQVRVRYRTSPRASGLQWMTPEMTQGKQLPLMFSQSQQIHARSWVPLQDTPQVRYTYSAHVTSRPDVMVLMSADNDPAAVRDGDYSFQMPQAIPSYLMAIAAGDLVFKPLSERSGVWAEPATVDAAVAEFADTEKMIATTETLYGPYRWGRYDLLILPPSFPYGGMENPRLSFITPTVIVGDKSLVSLIAHELAHSWSGNLVTMSSAKHGWLNEGTTTYVQNRVLEALYGQDFAVMERVISRAALRKSIADMPATAQALGVRPGVSVAPDFEGSRVAYDKGSWFWQFLEERYGREVFDPFLRGYFDYFAFRSIDTATFVEYFRTHLMAKHPGVVSMDELEQWLYEPGIPDNAPQVRSIRLQLVDTALKSWEASGEPPARELTNEWSSQEWIHFLEGLPETLPIEKLEALDSAYHFTGTANGELAQRWYPLAVRSGYKQAFPAMEEFLIKVGRRKLIMPTYAALVASEEGRVLAQSVLDRARPGYHPITTASVEWIIKGASGKDTP
ncbi:MAG TPA: M1 family metallopeptidase [Chiayiivirga sp.]|nr:M1 family metallopeptidase [Chiayiivirga sp.]